MLSRLFSKPKTDGPLPPGQFCALKFPVLSYGSTPCIDLKTWRFQMQGLVSSPFRLTWEEFRTLPSVQVKADFHCVTTWSKLDNLWEGVRVRALIDLAQPRDGVTHIMAHCYGGYTTNLPLDAVLADDVLVAYRHDGAELAPDHGGPARLVVPSRYGYKSAKWINALDLLPRNEHGFWELHGYNDNADPWKEERYSL